MLPFEGLVAASGDRVYLSPEESLPGGMQCTPALLWLGELMLNAPTAAACGASLGGTGTAECLAGCGPQVSRNSRVGGFGWMVFVCGKSINE